MTPRSLPATQLVAIHAEEPAAADGLCDAEKAAPVTCAECGSRLEPLVRTGFLATQGEGLVSDSGPCGAARIAATYCPTCVRRAVILRRVHDSHARPRPVMASSVVGTGSGGQAQASSEQRAPCP
jgi:hypothetical protein